MYFDTVRVPKDRISVVIGRDGSTKKEIEKNGEVKLTIDSDEGEVSIDQMGDAIKSNTAKSVVQAIGRGFNPEKAMLLFEEGMQLVIISLREFAKPGSSRIAQIKARVIGTGGKTRTIIEELTGSFISVYGDTVSIIGDYLAVTYAEEAINMIINGKKHRTVYEFLERKARELRFKRIEESFG